MNEKINLIFVFEAKTSRIDLPHDLSNSLPLSLKANSFSKSIRIFLHKMAQLQRQIFNLLSYYLVGVDHIYGGLVLFELYRNSKIDPNQLLKKISQCEFIHEKFPLIHHLTTQEKKYGAIYGRYTIRKRQKYGENTFLNNRPALRWKTVQTQPFTFKYVVKTAVYSEVTVI
jgi:hypothetical protein